MLQRVGQQIGHYQLARLLGRGSFADVYLGEHIHLKSQAAIKMLYTRLAPEHQESFLGEARLLSRFTHPHIIRVLDFGVEDDTPYLVMEYAPFGTLRQRHPDSVPLPLTTVVEYVKQIAAGLQYVHDHKLIHRDLKPENVLVGAENQLLLSDFGIALIAQTTHSHNQKEGFAGTAGYMAPEQMQGKPRMASDQYALGIMTYEWLCGKRPFTGTFLEIYSQHQLVAPQPLRELVPTLPPEVEQVVFTALQKDPGQRFSSVRAFANALEQAIQSNQPTVVKNHPSWPSIPVPGVQVAPAQSESTQPDLTETPLPISRSTSFLTQPDLTDTPLPLSAAPSSLLGSTYHPSVVSHPGLPQAQPSQPQAPSLTVPPFQVQSNKNPGSRRKVLLIGGTLLVLFLALFGAYFTLGNDGKRPHLPSIGPALSQNQTVTPVQSPISVGKKPSSDMQPTPTTLPGGVTNPKPTPTATLQPTPTPSPIPTPSPTPTPGGPPLVYSSTLSHQDSGNWTVGKSSDGSGCDFTGGAYHSYDATQYSYMSCMANAVSVTDFICQVQVKIISGDGGGLIFRANSTGSMRFRIGTDGGYDFVTQARSVTKGTSSAIKTGLNQVNTIKVVARGTQITLYVNGQQIANVTNSDASSGNLGLMGVNFGNTADVAFSNIQVWKL